MWHPSTPWAIYRDGNQSGIIESNYQQHKGPTKHDHDGWPLAQAGERFADLRRSVMRLAQIAQAITSMPGTPAELPAVEGLDNMYQGQLDNMLFAWQRYTNPFRALATGDMAYQEWFEHPGSAAYTMSAVLNLRTGDFKKRAFRSFQDEDPQRDAVHHPVRHHARSAGRLGDRRHSVRGPDVSHRLRLRSRSRRSPTRCAIGDDTEQQDPFAQGIKALQAVYTIASMAARGRMAVQR